MGELPKQLQADDDEIPVMVLFVFSTLNKEDTEWRGTTTNVPMLRHEDQLDSRF